MTTEAAGLGLTDVLAAHYWTTYSDGVIACYCGDLSDPGLGAGAAMRAHVAEEVRTWLRAALTSPEVRMAAFEAVKEGHFRSDKTAADLALESAAETLGAK